MQTIKMNFNINYPFVYDIVKMYEYYSNPEDYTYSLFDDNSLPKGLEPINDLIENGFNQHFNHFTFDKETSKIDVNLDKKKALVCFSGGKDSICTALKLKENYDVTLLYIDGINKSYTNERYSAVESAKILNLPLITYSVNLQGNTIFMENPVKNMVIFSFALNYGLKEGIANYFFGNNKQAFVYNSLFDRNFSDTVEMFELYTKHINTSYGLNIVNYPLIDSYVESIIWLGKHKELWNSYRGCITPMRFQKSLKKNNENKYNIVINENECGSCWKCCSTYIIQCDLGYREYNKEYYKHCLDILLKKVPDIDSTKTAKNYDEAYIITIGKELYEKSHLKIGL